jgi:hypothetical protein
VPCHAMPCHAMLRYATRRDATRRDATRRDATLRYAMLCQGAASFAGTRGRTPRDFVPQRELNSQSPAPVPGARPARVELAISCSRACCPKARWPGEHEFAYRCRYDLLSHNLTYTPRPAGASARGGRRRAPQLYCTHVCTAHVPSAAYSTRRGAPTRDAMDARGWLRERCGPVPGEHTVCSIAWHVIPVAGEPVLLAANQDSHTLYAPIDITGEHAGSDLATSHAPVAHEGTPRYRTCADNRCCARYALPLAACPPCAACPAGGGPRLVAKAQRPPRPLVAPALPELAPLACRLCRRCRRRSASPCARKTTWSARARRARQKRERGTLYSEIAGGPCVHVTTSDLLRAPGVVSCAGTGHRMNVRGASLATGNKLCDFVCKSIRPAGRRARACMVEF